MRPGRTHRVIRYYVWLRAVMIGGEILGVGIITFFLHLQIPWWPVCSVLAFMVAATFFMRRHALNRSAQRPPVLMPHLILDVSALFVLVYLTGGSMNPFISLFILPVVFAAATLSLGRTAIIALLAVAAYTLLMFFHQPIDSHHTHISGATLHLWGMWYGFVLAAICISALVARMSNEIRSRDRELAQAREAALKADRVVALGTLAAGTAHELGTPLSTIAVLANDLEIEAQDPDIRSRLQVLNETVGVCKEILSRLTSDAGQLQADSGRVVATDVYLDDLVSDWRDAQDDIDITFRSSGVEPAPQFVADKTLDQAIINVLNNAAAACRSAVNIAAHWDANRLTLDVTDDGTGMPDDIAERLGDEPMPENEQSDGLGIGIYLASTALRRLGGTLEFDLASAHGTKASISIPFAGLQLT